MRIALLVLALLLPGCAPDLTALASDPTSLCITATYVYGSISVDRNHGCSPVRAP